MIACTDTHGFEEGEKCAPTISVEHTLGYDMNLFGYDMILFGYDIILFGSFFKFQELSLMIVAALINFGVKNQVSQVSFKIAAGDLISFHTLGYDMKLFGSDMILCRYDMILIGSIFQVHELSVLLVAGFINFGVTNKVPQVSFKIAAGDLISLHSFGSDMNLFGSDLFSDMIICG